MIKVKRSSSTHWQAYVQDFHHDHAGITEAVLSRARGAGGTPYTWILGAVPPAGRVLDLGCGSAPLGPALHGRYLGVDLARAELAAARARGVPALARAGADRLPLADGSVDTVVASMVLMVASPLPAVLDEVRRVLRPGGRLVATLPARGPLPAGHWVTVAGLLLALGGPPPFPNDAALPRLPDLLAAAGLQVCSDERRRFVVPLGSAEDAAQVLESLYLPGTAERRRVAALRWLQLRARPGTTFPLPLRRIVALRCPAVRAPSAAGPSPGKGSGQTGRWGGRRT